MADRFLLAHEGPNKPHLSKGEVKDLREDVSDAFSRVAGEIDGLSGDSHTHANQTTLDLISAAFTTALKSTYDGYAAGKENAGVAAGLVSGHESTYNHVNFLSKNAVTAGPYTTITSITVTDGQVTAIVGS